ncbi:hypothetical protein OAM61_01705, partial [Schleiferiaceae bacterium]|nr:hypothetical protein [Schleiferiaceae bacterium]
MKKILYIPIKYESERVPGKNFKLLAGKPLYSYIFDTIIESEFFDDVFIDFDSKMARSNVELPKEFNYYFRPERLLGNDISSN